MVTHNVYADNRVSILRTNNIFYPLDAHKKQKLEVIIGITNKIVTSSYKLPNLSCTYSDLQHQSQQKLNN
jgi:hypothetical protein